MKYLFMLAALFSGASALATNLCQKGELSTSVQKLSCARAKAWVASHHPNIGGAMVKELGLFWECSGGQVLPIFVSVEEPACGPGTTEQQLWTATVDNPTCVVGYFCQKSL